MTAPLLTKRRLLCGAIPSIEASILSGDAQNTSFLLTHTRDLFGLQYGDKLLYDINADEDVDRTLSAIDKVLDEMSKE